MRENQNLFPYSSLQLLSLADNEHFARSSRGLATPFRWQNLGYSDKMLWGEYPQKDKEAIQVQITLPEMSFRCSCLSKTYPCHHGLALAFMFQEDSGSFQSSAAPAWTQSRKKLQYKEKYKSLVKPDRVQMQGFDMLETWIHDLLYHGLESARTYPYAFWHEMASRLVDARLAVLADDVRVWGQGSVKDEWSELLLTKLGKLQILLEGFKRFEDLAPELQADLLRAIGVSPRLSPEIIASDFLVLGRSKTQTSSRKLERIWLKDLANGAVYGVENPLLKVENSNSQLLVGYAFQGELQVYRSGAPLYAEIAAVKNTIQTYNAPTSESSIRAFLGRVATSTAKNPWMSVFPVELSEVCAIQENNNWLLIDKQGFRLPMISRAAARWHLSALALEPNFQLFGELRQGQVYPLSVHTAYGWLDLTIMRGGS
ncbi:MAG: hypothetical protein KC422_19105 [Trueperaceae bacterium]|nr:hypothetical protein [Trueperaceae bacterium]